MSKIGPKENYNLERIESDRAVNYEEKDDDAALNGRVTTFLFLTLLIAAVGSAYQFGWTTGLYNTPFDVIKLFYQQVYFKRYGKLMTESTFDLFWSITNGLLPLGGVVGGLSSGFAADYFGRKNGLILINIFVVISTILNVISKFIYSYETVMIGRFFGGVYCGLFSGVFPLYLSECPPKNLRGTFGALNQFSLVIGILVVNVFGLPEILGTPSLWPVLVGLTVVFSFAHIALFFLPESPKHLFINKNDKVGAKEALRKFRDNDMRLVEKELEQLEEEKRRLSQQSKIQWSDFLTQTHLKRALFVALIIQISQQFSGINAVIFYSTQIFQSAGLEGSWPIYGTIILAAVQIVMTLICMLIIDKAGRRILLVTGIIGMSISSFVLAIARIYGEPGSWVNYLTVVAAVIYIVFFSIGPGAIPWLITSELFGSDARGKATSIAVFTNWLSNLIVTITFPFIESAIGSYSFIIFGVLCAIFAIFMLLFVPETKNKSIDQIVRMFNNKIIFFPKGE